MMFLPTLGILEITLFHSFVKKRCFFLYVVVGYLSSEHVKRENDIAMVLAFFDQLMQRIKSNDKAHVSFCVTGIIGCLVVYGILQVGSLVKITNHRCFCNHLSNRCRILGVGTYHARAFWWGTI